MDVFQSRRGRNDHGRSNERDRSRDESDISIRDNRGDSRDRRSRSREGGHPLRARKSRSNSPQSEYTKVHDRWKKFKQSHRVSHKIIWH